VFPISDALANLRKTWLQGIVRKPGRCSVFQAGASGLALYPREALAEDAQVSAAGSGYSV